MKKAITRLVVTVLIVSVVGGAAYLFIQTNHEKRDLAAKLLTVEKQLSVTQNDLLGYTKYTDYVAESKKAIEGQMKFLAAKVDRQYEQIEHIRKSTVGIKTDAAISVNYSVEYSFGFDLKPESFSVSSDKGGITISLKKPDLVASPAINIRSHEILSTGAFIDEKAAVIALQQQLFPIAKTRAILIKSDEAVIALCEKRLAEFLRGFLANQPNIGVVPAIKFVYT